MSVWENISSTVQKYILKGTCANPSCEKWHSPGCLFYKTGEGFNFGDKCVFALRRVEELPSKRSKKNGNKSAVAMLKETMNSGCVFQDMEPPKSSSILRKSSTMRKPTRCVRFTKAVLRDTKIRDKNPSLNKICPGILISAAQMLQNLGIGLQRRQSGNSIGLAKQSGSWQRKSQSQRRNVKLHSSRLQKIWIPQIFWTVKVSQTPNYGSDSQCNGEVQTHEEATV